MAPRRSRKTTRMDAAFDAMKEYGFPKETVRAKMNELLKEYGGDVGYPFIELNGYEVLRDGIIADLEKESEQKEQSSKAIAEGETSRKDSSLEDEMVEDHVPLAIVGTLGGNVEPEGYQYTNTATPNNSRAQGDNRWKDIALDETCPPDMRTVETVACGFSQIGSLPLLTGGSSASSNPPRRRKPCYGWINDDDEDEDDNFVILTPAIVSGFSAPPPVTPSPQEQHPIKKVSKPPESPSLFMAM